MKNKFKRIAWLLAAALVLVASGALTHELDHQFHEHDAPCALHLYVDHLNGAPAARLAVALPVSHITLRMPPFYTRGTHAFISPYFVRGPPLLLTPFVL